MLCSRPLKFIGFWQERRIKPAQRPAHELRHPADQSPHRRKCARQSTCTAPECGASRVCSLQGETRLLCCKKYWHSRMSGVFAQSPGCGDMQVSAVESPIKAICPSREATSNGAIAAIAPPITARRPSRSVAAEDVGRKGGRRGRRSLLPRLTGQRVLPQPPAHRP
jgi:hypothetical protein